MNKMYVVTAALLVTTAGVCGAGVYREQQQIRANEAAYEKNKKSSETVTKLENTLSKEKQSSQSVVTSKTYASETKENSSTTEMTESKDKFKDKVENYRIQNGDTLSMIAQTCEISIDELLEMNEWKKPKSLIVGQNIKVPKGKAERLQEIHKKTSKSTSTQSVEKYKDTSVMATTASEETAVSSTSIQSLPPVSSASVTPPASVTVQETQVPSSVNPTPSPSTPGAVQNTVNPAPIQQ